MRLKTIAHAEEKAAVVRLRHDLMLLERDPKASEVEKRKLRRIVENNVVALKRLVKIEKKKARR